MAFFFSFLLFDGHFLPHHRNFMGTPVPPILRGGKKTIAAARDQAKRMKMTAK